MKTKMELDRFELQIMRIGVVDFLINRKQDVKTVSNVEYAEKAVPIAENLLHRINMAILVNQTNKN